LRRNLVKSSDNNVDVNNMNTCIFSSLPGSPIFDARDSVSILKQHGNLRRHSAQGQLPIFSFALQGQALVATWLL
jgi:hypothetical protein